MKRLQIASTLVLPKAIRAAGFQKMRRQNAFARRYGLPWLTTVICFFLVTVSLTWTYQAALYAVQSGLLNPPAKMADMFATENPQ